MFKYLITFLLSSIGCLSLSAQQVQQPVGSVVEENYNSKVARDSAFLARQKFVTDSIITHTWLIPDSLLSSSIIIDSILKVQVYNRPADQPWYVINTRKNSKSWYKTGKLLPKGNIWVLSVTGTLLVFFAVLKISFSKQLQTIIQSFFSNRILNNLNKEDNLFTSWPFLLLFILFGFTLGLFVFLVAQHYNLPFAGNGFQFFIVISVTILILFAFKIVLLRMLGQLFNIQKTVSDYISILYLSYFNISLIFIPLVTAYALSPLKYGVYYIVISFVLLALIFTFQFIRAGANILSNNRFSKVYLFLYFCALEICPILILIKAIGL